MSRLLVAICLYREQLPTTRDIVTMKKLSIVCIPLLAAALLFPGFPAIGDGPPLKQAEAAAKTVPKWIWLGSPSDSNETIYFRRTFELSSVPESVTVTGSCDNSMRVFINGKKVVSPNEWSTPVRAKRCSRR